jgi:predicted nucleic acid-binding Zn ribbon protein
VSDRTRGSRRGGGKGARHDPGPVRPTPLADALKSYLKRAGLTKRIGQAGVLEEWPTLVGPQIAQVTAPESVSPEGVLRVRVATAAWASELSLMTPQILARLNTGRSGRITSVRWLAGGLGR